MPCGTSISGDFNDDEVPVEIITPQYESNFIVDATDSSGFTITSINIYFKDEYLEDGDPIASDEDRDGIVEILDLPPNSVLIIVIDGQGTGIFDISTSCETSSPTTQQPTSSTTSTPDTTETSSTTNVFTTANPTATTDSGTTIDSSTPTPSDQTTTPQTTGIDTTIDSISSTTTTSSTIENTDTTRAVSTSSTIETADPTTQSPTTSQPTTQAPTSKQSTTAEPTTPDSTVTPTNAPTNEACDLNGDKIDVIILNDIDSQYQTQQGVSSVDVCKRHQDMVATTLTTIKGPDEFFQFGYSFSRVAYIEFDKTIVDTVTELQDEYNVRPVTSEDIQDYNDIIENRPVCDSDIATESRSCKNGPSMLSQAITTAMLEFANADSDNLQRDKFIIIFTNCPITDQTEREMICNNFEDIIAGGNSAQFNDGINVIMMNTGNEFPIPRAVFASDYLLCLTEYDPDRIFYTRTRSTTNDNWSNNGLPTIIDNVCGNPTPSPTADPTTTFPPITSTTNTEPSVTTESPSNADTTAPPTPTISTTFETTNTAPPINSITPTLDTTPSPVCDPDSTELPTSSTSTDTPLSSTMDTTTSTTQVSQTSTETTQIPNTPSPVIADTTTNSPTNTGSTTISTTIMSTSFCYCQI